MNILSICTVLNNSYLAIEYENNIYSEIIKSDENYHSLYLISKIKQLCHEKKIVLKNLDAITANIGPGSFTGIRVCLTIAKTLAGELNIPLIGLNSSEILLSAYNKKFLLMDARRDMFYLGTKNNIELIYKDKLSKIDENELLCDQRSLEYYPNALCYETQNKNLGLTMISLAKQKYNNSKNKSEEFNFLTIEANYIQTPPVF